jgi:hypothetical protein
MSAIAASSQGVRQSDSPADQWYGPADSHWRIPPDLCKNAKNKNAFSHKVLGRRQERAAHRLHRRTPLWAVQEQNHGELRAALTRKEG